MAEDKIKPQDLIKIDHKPPAKDWLNTFPDFNKGTFNYAAVEKSARYLGLPNPRKWQPMDKDWQLPENWQVQIPTS